MTLRRALAAFVASLAFAGCSKAPRDPADPTPAAMDEVVRSAEAPARRPRPTSATGARPAPRATELDPASVAILKQAFESKDYATRLIAIEAVADAHAEPLLGWLEHALGDPEHDVRMAAVEALDRLHSTRALMLLATVRDDTSEDLDVRAVAAGALLRTTP